MKLIMNIANNTFSGLNVLPEGSDYGTIELIVQINQGNVQQEHTLTVDVLRNRTSVQSSNHLTPLPITPVNSVVVDSPVNVVTVSETNSMVAEMPSIASVLSSGEFYLGIPSVEGSFSCDKCSEEQTAECLYLFQIKRGVPDKAFFSINVTDAALLIEQNEQTILPACDVYPTKEVSPTIIYTVQNGMAVKQGNIWKVTMKAKIEYK